MSILLLKRGKQKGIALIQILLISTIISILAIRFTITAREQIKTSELFDKRVKVELLLRSTQNEIIFDLYTLQLEGGGIESSVTKANWNFYGKPFPFKSSNNANILVSLQSSIGLLSQRYVKTPFWHRALTVMEVPEPNKFIGELQDWQDKDKNSWIIGNLEPSQVAGSQHYRDMPIQLENEINWIMHEQPQYIDHIKLISTPHAVVGLNLLYSPDSLIQLIFEKEIASQIMSLRESNQLTLKKVLSFLNDEYDDEYMSKHIGNKFRLRVQVAIDEVKLVETIEFQLEPRKTEPLLIFSRR